MDNAMGQMDWIKLCPSLKLVKTGREALQPARLGIGLLWVGAVWGGAQLLHAAFGDERQSAWVFNRDGDSGRWEFTGGTWGLLVLAWMLVCALFFGGMISRLAALRVATGQSAPLRACKAFLAARGLSLLGAAGMILLPFVLLGGMLALGGLLFFSFSWTAMVGALMFGAAILIGAIMAALGVLAIICLLLLLPAISVDGNDGFDAPGRSVSYVLGRPWLLALHLAVLAVFGAVFVGLALWLEQAAVTLAQACVQAGSCNGVFAAVLARDADYKASSSVLSGWKMLAFSLVLAYAFSFLVTGLTRIYFLIRESADGVPETDVWQPTDDQKVTMGVEEEQAHA